MKVILYMAVSVDGFVAKENDDTASWVSEIEWESYRKMTQEVGNVIIGRRTFEVALREGDFPFQNCFNVVVTDKEIENKWENDAIFVRSPKQALKTLEEKGFSSALVGGGGALNGSFMQEGLVDEIYLDIEPVALGVGIQLFGGKDLDVRLKLLGTKKLSENEIQLHYQVEKHG